MMSDVQLQKKTATVPGSEMLGNYVLKASKILLNTHNHIFRNLFLVMLV